MRSSPVWTQNCPTVTGDAPGLIDTNIVISLGAIDPVYLPKQLVICAVTLAELSSGPHHAKDPIERARRISVLQHAETTFDPLPFDAEAARAFGLCAAAVLTTNRKPRNMLADLMIAATAIANRLPLYTMNPRDFMALEPLLDVTPVPRPGRLQ